MPISRCLTPLVLMLTAAGWFAASCRADLPVLTVLHTFGQEGPGDLTPSHNANSDGAWPEAPLMQGSDGTFYGTASSGGANGTGVIFKISGDGTGFTVLHSFGPLSALFGNETNADGCWPKGALVQGKDGALYGVAGQGGEGRGLILQMTPDGKSVVAQCKLFFEQPLL